MVEPSGMNCSRLSMLTNGMCKMKYLARDAVEDKFVLGTEAWAPNLHFLGDEGPVSLLDGKS